VSYWHFQRVTRYERKAIIASMITMEMTYIQNGSGSAGEVYFCLGDFITRVLDGFEGAAE